MAHSDTSPAKSHPLLAPRAPRDGFVRYIHTDEEIREMIRVIWSPAEDKAAAAKAIQAIIGRSRFSDAIRDSASGRATETIERAPARRGPSRPYTTCRRCGGPLAIHGHSPALCGEC